MNRDNYAPKIISMKLSQAAPLTHIITDNSRIITNLAFLSSTWSQSFSFLHLYGVRFLCHIGGSDLQETWAQ